MSVSSVLSLSKWEHNLSLMPLEHKEKETIFTAMLKKCKIIKFQEVNFKILSRILLTPAVLSAIKSDHSIGFCHWCGVRANIDHILLDCIKTKKLHKLVELIMGQLQHDSWVFGASRRLNPVIWTCNFSIYKSHLMACDNKVIHPLQLFLNECHCFILVYDVLEEFTCIDGNNILLQN